MRLPCLHTEGEGHIIVVRRLDECCSTQKTALLAGIYAVITIHVCASHYVFYASCIRARKELRFEFALLEDGEHLAKVRYPTLIIVAVAAISYADCFLLL